MAQSLKITTKMVVVIEAPEDIVLVALNPIARKGKEKFTKHFDF